MLLNYNSIEQKKINNCGAFCGECQKDNMFYSILNNSFVYYCLNCKKWIKKENVFNNKESINYYRKKWGGV